MNIMKAVILSISGRKNFIFIAEHLISSGMTFARFLKTLELLKMKTYQSTHLLTIKY